MSNFSDQMDAAGLLPHKRESQPEKQSVESHREDPMEKCPDWNPKLPVAATIALLVVGLLLLFFAAGGTIVFSIG